MEAIRSDLPNPTESFIDLRQHRRFRNVSGMTNAGLVVLLSVLGQAPEMRYDVVKLIDTLFKEKSISSRECGNLKSMYTRGNLSQEIIIKASRYCSLQSLIDAMNVCNYTDITEKLKSYRKDMNSVTTLNQADIGNLNGSHSAALELYLRLKKNIDNSVFVDKEEFLRVKTEKLKTELEKLDPELTRRKSCLLDKLLVVKCVSVEVTTDLSDRFDVLNDIRNDNTVTNTKTAEACIYSKEACTYALKGDFELGEALMSKARLIFIHVNASWVIYFHYLNELFLKVAKFEKMPSDENKQSLLFYGFSGLRSVANEAESTQRMFKRIYFSFMLYGLLSLGLFLNEINFPISPEDKSLARTLLLEFNRLSEGMETRRDMLYAFFMSRLYEKDDTPLALVYAKRARTLSESGELRKGEKENIYAFAEKLSRLSSMSGRKDA